MKKLLIANRGEIAIRIARTASDMGVASVGVYSEDDAKSLHVRQVDEAVALGASGAAAYLDIERILDVAAAQGCDAIHPGYGFLSEQAAFSEACEQRGVTFVGPTAQTLDLFGDKSAARDLAARCGVPTPPGLPRGATFEDAYSFFEGLGPGHAVMVKAVAGGGGRGMRPVHRLEDLRAAFDRCRSEAEKAFGSGEVYVEELLPRARHIEVQIVGDGSGAVSHLWDRECSLQRQRQKIIEVAPAFGLADDMRGRMLEAAVALGAAVRYRGVGTIEFLIDASEGAPARFLFIEANARLQVEHTVTEAILGLDLVAAQLRLADGATLEELGLLQGAIPDPHGVAVQARVNLETLNARGVPLPAGGLLTAYEPPAGPGVRVDGYGYAGYATSARYDPLLAKVVVHAPDLATAVRKGRRALGEFRIEGSKTNIPVLRALLASSAFSAGEIHTRYVEENAAGLVSEAAERVRYFEPSTDDDATRAGAKVDSGDPLAVLSVRARPGPPAPASATDASPSGPEGSTPVAAPIQGVLVRLLVEIGDHVREGQPVAVMEALKMEHEAPSPISGIVRAIPMAVGEAVFAGAPILFIEAAVVDDNGQGEGAQADPDAISENLAKVLRLHELTTDAARAEATAKRHAQGKRTARENIEHLCDPGSFVEFGPIVTASRRFGESIEALETRVAKTPGDGMVMGVGRVNGELVGRENARCVAMSYDYMVLAGTQGGKNHQKTDRMLDVAERFRLPVVFFTEGGGGRTGGGRLPGDPPAAATSTGGLKVGTWRALGKLSGLTPLVGVASGRCFAGNAVVLALCDVIIATRDATIGVGGPAMIEGGGLGVYAPEEVGPVAIQEPNGVIDVLVEDEADATRAAKLYLSFFQGPAAAAWQASDQQVLRRLVPTNRRAVYDIRKIIETLADVGSMLELRPRFGLAMVTAFIRVEGRPVGVIANNSRSPTGGAVDSDAADKAARFMQL
ncbi:MAG: carboxyl transferase domain-containing protein, partial [Caulobacteraceae bacterium]